MAKKKKGPPGKRPDANRTTMSGLASLGAQVPGALNAQAAPFDLNKAPDDHDEGPMETLDIDVAELGLPDEASDVEEHEDGSATISLDDADGVTGDVNDFYVNLATCMSEDDLNEIGERYARLIEQDIEARKERDKQQEEGLKRAGLGGPAPGGADFEGASRVTHPVLAEAYVDFSASTMKELFPSSGPVRTYIAGTVTDEKMQKAQRKRDYMNYQLTREIPEYRSELESLLTQLPAGGSQFMKVYYSHEHKRPMVDFIPIDDFILPFSAKTYVRSQRKFHRMTKSEWEYQKDVESGLYIDLHMPPPATAGAITDETASQAQTNKIEGKSANEVSDDGEYVFFEGSVWDKFEDPLRPKNRSTPYIITLDQDTHKVLALYRNWCPEEAKKDKYVEQKYIVKFGFIPWRGAYDIGLPQLIGDLAAAMTGALRALLDSAHIQNSATAIKLKGRPGGESVNISPTQVGEIDSLGQDDIRKVMMPIAFNGPSPVLLQLLGYLTNAAKEVVTTSEEKISEAGNGMPVGTAIALIEQGAKVYSAIHARLHNSQAECLEIMCRLNKQHLPAGKTMFGDDENDYVTPQDFEGATDVIPVSDPNIFSETQRYAQIQAVIALRQQFPGQINDAKILTRMLQLMKFPDYKDILNTPPAPKPANPAAENVMMAMGKPATAFPEQDHVAHIQVHLDFLKSPFFGMNPLIAKVIIPAMMDHVKQHVLFYYADLMRLEGRTQLGEPVEERAHKDKTWQGDRDISDALAKSSETVMAAVSKVMSGVTPVMEQAMQMLQKVMQPPAPHDPNFMLGQMELQQRAKEHTDDNALAQARLQKDVTKMQHDFDIKHSNIEFQLQKLMQMLANQRKIGSMEAITDMASQHVQANTKLQTTRDNNETALEIATMRGEGNMKDGGSMSH